MKDRWLEAEFEEQLKSACAGEQHADGEEKRLNALIAENSGKVKVDG